MPSHTGEELLATVETNTKETVKRRSLRGAHNTIAVEDSISNLQMLDGNNVKIAISVDDRTEDYSEDSRMQPDVLNVVGTKDILLFSTEEDDVRQLMQVSSEIRRMPDLINNERRIRGLNELCFNSKIIAAAQGHSDDMTSNLFFSHTGSDGSSVGTRVQRTGYSNTCS